jgi:hypothetical protein
MLSGIHSAIPSTPARTHLVLSASLASSSYRQTKSDHCVIAFRRVSVSDQSAMQARQLYAPQVAH